MNILLTNDDGYNSKGILLLKKLLSKYGTVVIVAPDSHRSGASASLTITEPLQLVEVEKNVYKCSGTPVDCVSMGLCCFDISFDLVVSGCNDSWNISYDTMYSGTVGAAQESLIFGIPSIAVSAHSGNDFIEVEQYFDAVWKYIHEHELLGKEHLLNINFPLGKVEKIALGNLYYRKDQNYFTKTDKGFMALRHLQTDFSDDKNGDCYQVEHGVISIVPLSRSYFNKDLKEKLNKNTAKL